MLSAIENTRAHDGCFIIRMLWNGFTAFFQRIFFKYCYYIQRKQQVYILARMVQEK